MTRLEIAALLAELAEIRNELASIGASLDQIQATTTDADTIVFRVGMAAMAVLAVLLVTFGFKWVRDENRRKANRWRERDARRHGYPSDGDQ